MPVEIEKTPTVVVVDDDELILSSMRVFLSLETDYKLMEFNDPLRAVSELKHTPVDVVISDFMMPGMNGIDFLLQMKRLQPEAVRVLLTGFADKANAIRGINEVGLYQYLEKPWDPPDILLVLRNALSEKNLRKQLAEKVRALDRLLREHNQLAERHSSLERELEMAARVQRSLLPSEFPKIEGFHFDTIYQPSRAIGGDYYDYSLVDGNIVLLVCDVSGHGIQAALIGTLVKAIFHDAARKSTEPSQLLTEMNARLYSFLPEGMYAAAAVTQLNPQSGQIRLANAGLPYPFLLNSQTQRFHEIPLNGIPLGLFGPGGPSSYDARDWDLAIGDVLIIASDGLGDVCGKDDEFFQDRELRRALSEFSGKDGSQILAGLVERAQSHSNGRGFPDDVSIVAITRSH